MYAYVANISLTPVLPFHALQWLIRNLNVYITKELMRTYIEILESINGMILKDINMVIKNKIDKKQRGAGCKI